MSALIFFEIRKFFKKKKNIIGIVVVILITLLFSMLNFSLDVKRNDKNSKIHSIKDRIKSLEDSTTSLKSKYENFKKEQPSVANRIKLLIDNNKYKIGLLEDKKQGLINSNWRKVLKSQISLDQHFLKEKREGRLFGGEDSSVIKERLKINQLLLKKNIKPIDTDVSITSFNLIKLIARDLVPLILIILIFLFASDSVSSDIDEGTFKFLLIQPISRNKVILSKIIAYSIVCTLIITLLFSVFFIGAGVTVGSGSPEYPIKYYSGSFKATFGNNVDYGFEYIDIQTFITYMIPFLFLIILAIVSIATFISTIVGNSLAAISISVIFYISSFIINSQLGMLSKISHLIPFTYMNIPMLLRGDLMSTYQNNNITYINGVIVLLLTIILFNSISVLSFRKKDIL